MSDTKVLDYSTLNITLKELTAAKQYPLAEKIKLILQNNKLPKPALHARPGDHSTDYYTVDLNAEEVNEVIDLFLGLEVEYVGEDGEATPTCSFYASLTDKWHLLAE